MISTNNSCSKENRDEYLKYLEFIQGIITRMNGNSFQLKGWCVTVVIALLATWQTQEKNKTGFPILAALSVIPFWCLDAYYLLLERQYRGLYSDAIKGGSVVRMFDMSVKHYTPGMSHTDTDKKEYSYEWVLISKSVLLFYFPLLFLCLILALFTC